jgi:putative addiction module killer protein
MPIYQSFGVEGNNKSISLVFVSLLGENPPMQILHYLTVEGRDLFQDWLDDLRDMRARIAILRRVDRVAKGNFGDHRFCREGVWELRIDVGAGYRVYYAQAGQTIVLLLCGGDKRTQDTDIARAVDCWQDYQRRDHEDTTPS